MTIMRGAFHSDLLPGLVKKWFSVNPSNLASLYDKMMKVEASDRAYEIHATVTGMGTMVVKGENASLTLDDSSEAYKPIYEHTTFSLGFAISREMMDDGIAFGNAKKFTEMLRRAANQTKEIVAANIINNAGTSGYTMKGGDGVILASASHVTASGNQSNILASAADLSEAALEAVRTQVERALDNRGLILNLSVKDLIVSPEQRADAYRILQSDRRVGTTDNDANFLKDTGVVKNVIVNPFLTSATQWQVSTSIDDGLKFLVRKEAQMDTDNDFMTQQGLYSSTMRISAGWDDFRGLYISL